MKGTFLHMLLNRIATMITSIFQNNNDADSFISRFKDNYNQKTPNMNTTSETPGYLIPQTIPQKRESLNNNIPVAHFAAFDLLTFKHGVMKTWILKSVLTAIVLLIINLLVASVTFGQITQPTAWTKAYDQATSAGTGTNITIAAGSNRILVVGITTTYSSAGGSGTQADPTTISYGGVTLTKATGNGATSGRMHTWLYYLKDNAVMDNTSRPINVTVGAVTGSTLANMTVWYGVYAGVDQAPASYTTGNNLSNTDAATAAQLSTTMAVNANAQAVYISSIYNSLNTTIPTYTINANWTSGGTSTGTSAGTVGWKTEVAKRTIPGSNVTDNAATSTISPNSRYAMSAMSLPKFCVPPTITGTLSACVGSTTQLTGSGTAAASNPWLSATTTVATVNSTGLVTAVAAGTSVITYTNDLGCSNTATVTVNALPTISGTLSVCTGSTTQLTGSGTAAASTPWLSATTTVATVSNTGLVTGVAAGTSVITYTNNLGCVKTATVTVNVTPTVTPGTDPSVCRGTTSALLAYSTTNSPNQYSIVYDATAISAGFASVTNAALPGSNIALVIPAAATANVYNGILTVRNSVTGCVSANSAITVTVLAPAVSFTGPVTVCLGQTSTLSPTTGGIWVSNSPAVATVDNNGDITSVGAGSATFTFTETATGCSNTTGGLTVNTNSSVSLSSAVGTDAQTKCISTAITNITYQGAGSITSAPVTGLPTGVTGAYNSGTKVVTISGTPTVAGTFNYTVNIVGPCSNSSIGGTITVNANATISLSSGAGTNIQAPCTNSPITNITYAIGGSGTGASVTGLPAGVTGSYNAGVYTISGSPSVVAGGTFNYTITTTGPCVNPNLTGTLTVKALPVTTGTTICQGGSGTISSSTVCASASPVTTAATNAGAGQNTTGVGTIAWTNPGNILTNNNSYATVVLPNNTSVSNYLRSSGYSFGSIPANATINGIQVTMGKFASNVSGSTRFRDNEVRLVKAGTVVGTNKANAGVDWPQAEAASTYGTTSDLWGTTWTVADLTNANFGAALSGLNATGVGNSYTGSVDYMQITVTYTVPGSLNWYTASSGGTLLGSGSPFNPVGVAGSGLANTNTAGTTTFYAECSTVAGCRTATDFVINALPTVSITGSSAICNPGSTTLSPTTGGTWVSNDAAASVDNAGNVTAVSAGTATFTFTQTGTGCTNTTAVVTVNANSTISLSSAAGTDGQTKCINTAITNITYAIGGGGTGATVTGLPAGITGAYNAGVFTISGAATVSGSFSYTVTTAGPCVNASLSGTIDISPAATISLSSAVGSDVQTLCVNSTITDITYAIGSTGTGATVTGLPSGVTGSYNAGVFTISGTVLASGTYFYTVTTTGPCANPSLGGTISVAANSTIALSSAAGTDAQTKCINTAITNITYAIGGGGTGASITAGALPAGVTGSYNAGVFTISGTATATGSYSYTVTTDGPCVNNSISGAINITPNATISLTSAAGTDVQHICNNSAITPISYTVAGGGTGAGVTGLPTGVSGLFNAGVFTISGTATSVGTFNYTVTTTGTCIQAIAAGTITVGAIPTATFTRTNVSSCGAVADGTIIVTASGGTGPYTYSWTGMTGIGAHVPYSAGNTASVSGLDIGYYNVTFTDVYGCTGTITGIHIQYAFAAYITNNGSISASCVPTGSILLYANAGVQPYTFSLDGTNYQSSNSFLNLAAGLYTAYVKDGAGCVITKSITVASAAPIVVNPFVRPASSCSNDGSIEIYRTGGIPPYMYSLDGTNYQSGNVYSNLTAGPYTTYVKDSKGCIGSTTVTVSQGASLVVNATKTLVSTCMNDGSFQLSAVGGFPPYAYSKDDITYQSSSTFGGLGAGNYTGWVKDSKGCKGFKNITLNLNPIAVTSFVTDASDCVSSNGKIQLFRTGGVGPYTYSLDGNTYQSSPSFTGLAAGTYDGYVKDSKSCLGVQVSITVGPIACIPAPPTATKGMINETKTNTVKVSANSVLKISAYPNPSETAFTLLLEGNSNEKVVITVTDLLGRKVYQAEGDVKKQYIFGNNLKAGIYILQVVQGNDKQSTKLIKE